MQPLIVLKSWGYVNNKYFIVEMLENLKAYAGETIKPDDWDLAMIEQARQENDGVTVTLDELAQELEIEL